MPPDGLARRVQQQDRFPVVTIDLKITCLSPGRIFDKFQPHIPGGRDSELFPDADDIAGLGGKADTKKPVSDAAR